MTLRSLALLLSTLAAVAFQGLQIPAPRGYVNDFANVISADNAARMERIIDDVRAKSGGEIVVVTLPDLGGRPIEEVALRIGREWQVGPTGLARVCEFFCDQAAPNCPAGTTCLPDFDGITICQPPIR